MHYIIVDIEATCWENNTDRERMETIEIGAVRLPTSNGPVTGEFSRFIKPVATSMLSPFCVLLTSIQQSDVNTADYFWTVFPEFTEWIGPETFILCSWGVYDLNQFRIDCQRHKMAFPSSLERHINLKKEFARWKGVRPCGMKTALDLLQLPFQGKHHRALDDAHNITAIALLFLPYLEAQDKERD